MEAAIVYRWSSVKVGREAKALENFANAMTFWEKRIADGKASSSLPVITAPVGGVWIIQGDEADLAGAIQSDEHRRISIVGAATVDDFDYRMGAVGDGLQEQLQAYGATLADNGFI